MKGLHWLVVTVCMGSASAAPSGALGFANPDAIPGRGPRSTAGVTVDPALFPKRSNAPLDLVGGGGGITHDGPRGSFTSPTLPHRDFDTNQELLEALELSQAALELRNAQSVAHALALLRNVEGRLGIAASRPPVGQLRGRVEALARAAAPRIERAWPAVRHQILAQTSAWLRETGRWR